MALGRIGRIFKLYRKLKITFELFCNRGFCNLITCILKSEVKKTHKKIETARSTSLRFAFKKKNIQIFISSV